MELLFCLSTCKLGYVVNIMIVTCICGLPACMSHCVGAVTLEARRGHQIAETGVTVGGYSGAMWVLEIKPGSSGKVASNDLNHWAISPTHLFF